MTLILCALSDSAPAAHTLRNIFVKKTFHLVVAKGSLEGHSLFCQVEVAEPC